jgi:23S rRNA (pseudouridine1915-N3)-methyltransferase
MKWHIIAVGKPSLSWARAGLEDYLGRLSRGSQVRCSFVKEGPLDVLTERLLTMSDGTERVLLDERGVQLRSQELARWINQRQLHGCKEVSLLIGGADGHGALMRERVRDMWSLSKFTLQHELALVVLLEQIYRAYTILRGEPYHRE